MLMVEQTVQKLLAWLILLSASIHHCIAKLLHKSQSEWETSLMNLNDKVHPKRLMN